MAFRDADSGRIVTRVVYDGLAFTGKTTNLRRLCDFFTTLRRSELHTPEEEDGRTSYFDFLRLDGGLIAGHPLSCHLVTVPGQTGLVRRRQFLLGEADAVVLVCDSTPQGVALARRRLEATRRFFEKERGGTPLHLVVQANKQDLAEALDPEAVREALELDARAVVIPAQAMEGVGVRETAVLGIRAAVDRVQAVVSRHGVDALPIAKETAERLHDRMLEEERKAVLAGSVLELSGPTQVDANGLPEWDDLSSDPGAGAAAGTNEDAVAAEETPPSTRPEPAAAALFAGVAAERTDDRSTAPTAGVSRLLPRGLFSDGTTPPGPLGEPPRTPSEANYSLADDGDEDETTLIPASSQDLAESEAPDGPTLVPLRTAETETAADVATESEEPDVATLPPRTRAASASPAQGGTEPENDTGVEPAVSLDAGSPDAAPEESDAPKVVARSDTNLRPVATPRDDDPPWPQPAAASGHIWPGTTGRDMLRRLDPHVAVRRDDLLSRAGNLEGSGKTDLVLFEVGDLCVKTSGRRFYQDVDEARIGMAHMARAKISLGGLRPDPTVLALAIDGRGTWLWTVTPWLTTLRGALDQAAAEQDGERVADALDQYARASVEALTLTRTRGVLLDIHPSNFALQDGRVVYIDDDVEVGSTSLAAGHALLQRMGEYGSFPEALDRYLDTLESEILSRLGWDGAQAVGLVDSLSGAIVSSVQARAAQGRLVEVLTRPRPAIGNG